jgi:MFS family permease
VPAVIPDLTARSVPVAARAWSARTFRSLQNPNYRNFFLGQAVSLVGTWMQSVAQAWLVLELSGSGTTLGLVVAVQTLPVLLVGPYGGVLADRADKRRLLIGTQSAFALLALTLGVLTLTHAVRLWMVIAVAGGFGIVTSIDNPARQAFVPEMVGPASVANAVTLNSALFNAARAVGPAVAGVLIVSVGVGDCFVLNALSFAAVIVALRWMDPRQLLRAHAVRRDHGQLVAGLRYVRGTPGLLVPLLMMAMIGALSYEFGVVLPVLAQRSFHGNADAFGFLTAAFGVGAMIGGLAIAGSRVQSLRGVVVAAGAFGASMLAAAVAPDLVLASIALAVVGAASVAFMSRGNSLLQLTADESMRGRVMALWAVAFLGTTPIGGPAIGWISQHLGPRWGLATGGLAALVATALAAYPRLRPSGHGRGRAPA